MSAQAGIIYRDSRPVPTELVGALGEANVVRGPDRVAHYLGPGIAMLAFSAHFDRLSTTEHQPIRRPDGSVLTWDGRLDNREDLFVCLQMELANGTSDADLVAAAISRWGTDALEQVLGDWSLASWNERRRELLLARDYAGNRPLFYCSREECFIWSTELNPIVSIVNLHGSIDDSYISASLTGQSTEHHTYYDGVFSVPRGHALLRRHDGSIRCRPVARLVPCAIKYRDRRDYAEHYRELLIESVQVRLRSRKPVWTELSGGYDSSAVTCIASGLVKGGEVEASRLQPVSVVSPDSPESDESVYVAHVERFCGIESVKLPFVGWFAFDTADARDHRSGDVVDPSPLATAAAKDGGQVLLSGELGDLTGASVAGVDLLRDHIRRARVGEFLKESLVHCRAAREPLALVWTSLFARLLAPRCYAWWDRTHFNRKQRALRGAEADFAARFAIHQNVAGRAPASTWSLASCCVPSDLWNRAGLEMLCTFAGRNFLTGECGHNTLNRTHPFSHKPLLEFVLASPPGLLGSTEHPRAFHCAALRDVLPPAIIQRRHKGYASPVIARHLMAEAASEASRIHDWQLVKRGYVDPKLGARLFLAFTDGARAIQGTVFDLFKTERLLRRLDPGA